MKVIVLSLVCIYIFVTLTILGYDVIIAFIERYSHFHMGRWSNVQKWKEAITKVCCKWVVHTPVLRMRKDCRYLLIDKIRGKSGKKMVQSWQTAGCVLGLAEVKDDCAERAIVKAKQLVIDENGDWKINIDRIDYGMLAYSLLKHEKNPMDIKKAMDRMVTYIESNLCADGMISYSAGKTSKRRYVDTLGFVCPFLALYGKSYDKMEYVDLAVNQIKYFRNKGFSKGLLVHCYSAENDLPLGTYGWGRGTGWYMLGLIDSYLELDDISAKETLKQWCIEIAELSLKFERPDGGFSSILPSFSVYDSSATAMLGYFYAQCGKLFSNETYIKVAERCIKHLIEVTKISGVVDECQGDTVDIGIFSERYASMPFVQGMTLRLASVLEN